MYTEAARALITRFPNLADVAGTGYVSSHIIAELIALKSLSNKCLLLRTNSEAKSVIDNKKIASARISELNMAPPVL